MKNQPAFRGYASLSRDSFIAESGDYLALCRFHPSVCYVEETDTGYWYILEKGQLIQVDTPV